jgi:outer membrane protein TolC
LVAARAGVSAARASRHSAKAEAMPNAGLNVGGRIQGPKTTIRQPTGQIDLNDRPVTRESVLNPTHSFEPGVQGQQAVYSGGRITAQQRAARRGERAALARAESEAQRLVLDVTEAYLDTLEAQQQSGLAGAQRELNEERLQVAQVRLSAGTGILLEATQAEADLAQAVQREIEAQARQQQTGATLNSLIGRPVTAPLVLVDLPATQPGAPLLVSATAPPTPERLRQLGLERPEMQALREDVHRAEAEVAVARAASRPQFSLSSSYLRRIPETLFGAFSWSLGASLVQTLVDGGRARAGVEAAKAEQARRAAVLADTERRVEAEVESARVALEAAERRLAAEEKRVGAATLAASDAHLRLEAGTAAPIEVTEAQTVLTRAQTDAVTARFEAARARVRLAFAVGLAHPETIVAPTATPMEH